MTGMRTLEADGLVLDPLIVAHAEAMLALLSDPPSIATSTRRRRLTSISCAPATPGWSGANRRTAGSAG